MGKHKAKDFHSMVDKVKDFVGGKKPETGFDDSETRVSEAKPLPLPKTEKLEDTAPMVPPAVESKGVTVVNESFLISCDQAKFIVSLIDQTSFAGADGFIAALEISEVLAGMYPNEDLGMPPAPAKSKSMGSGEAKLLKAALSKSNFKGLDTAYRLRNALSFLEEKEE